MSDVTQAYDALWDEILNYAKTPGNLRDDATVSEAIDVFEAAVRAEERERVLKFARATALDVSLDLERLFAALAPEEGCDE